MGYKHGKFWRHSNMVTAATFGEGEPSQLNNTNLLPIQPFKHKMVYHEALKVIKDIK